MIAPTPTHDKQFRKYVAPTRVKKIKEHSYEKYDLYNKPNWSICYDNISFSERKEQQKSQSPITTCVSS